ncbi:MAG: Uma2 family endonuclease [Chloroflexi bacterium]|uniref:Uma2 family endonuclease n=1 Tax=Candidatus Chlorohelix allophototropha TaxID=3003348 RepID=A0A8T7M9E6_9CHLR|nr:Uma2 family endonuclease [Chloroflexota bacterium]WJW68675.1 Uma2 family endonuclease [Chloroflexota bacterium L227-S17]
MVQPARQNYTPEEYLRLEESSLEKHEFYKGDIFLMAGATESHNLIAANAIIELGSGLRGKPCKVYSSDMRIQVQSNGLYTYADVSVVCGQVEFATSRTDTITNPILIIEVLSPSTEKYDRSQKFELYRALTSLENYLVIDQARIYVEYHRRVEGTKWLMETYSRLDEVIKLPWFNLQIPLVNLYDKTDLVI